MFLILQERNFAFVQTYISPKSLIHATYDSIKWFWVLLSNNLLFRFNSKNEFILGICKVGLLKKKCLSHGKWNYFAWKFFFTERVFTVRLWIKNHWWNVRVFINKQITKPFLGKIFWAADSKSLRLRSAAFKMQLLNHGVWGSPLKRGPTVCAKTVSSLLREST